jgi:polar amino acid transport system permease protein
MTALWILAGYWDFILFGPYPKGPLGGLALTAAIALTSLSAAFPLALAVALARLFGPKAISRAATAYVYIARGVPLLVWIFWIYFLIPLLTKQPADAFVTLVVAIVIYQGAYLSEVLRAGIVALPKGQFEAARALGLRSGLVIRKIVLPQIVVQVMPGLINQMTLIIKESALGYVIALGELTFVMGQINLDLMNRPLSVFAMLAAIYFVICWLLSRLANVIVERARWVTAKTDISRQCPPSASQRLCRRRRPGLRPNFALCKSKG